MGDRRLRERERVQGKRKIERNGERICKGREMVGERLRREPVERQHERGREGKRNGD